MQLFKECDISRIYSINVVAEMDINNVLTQIIKAIDNFTLQIDSGVSIEKYKYLTNRIEQEKRQLHGTKLTLTHETPHTKWLYDYIFTNHSQEENLKMWDLIYPNVLSLHCVLENRMFCDQQVDHMIRTFLQLHSL